MMGLGAFIKGIGSVLVLFPKKRRSRLSRIAPSRSDWCTVGDDLAKIMGLRREDNIQKSDK